MDGAGHPLLPPCKNTATLNTNREPGDLRRNQRSEQIGSWTGGRAADARSVGPVRGRKFTPAAIEATHARTRRSIPSRSYSGSIAGMVSRNVTAPDPSRCTSSARESRANNDARAGVGSDRVKNPINDRVEQARVPSHHAKVHRMRRIRTWTRQDAVCCSPATMNFAVSSPNPARSAVVTGTHMAATTEGRHHPADDDQEDQDA